MTRTMTLEVEAVPVVKSGLEMKKRALELGLRQYNELLGVLEQKYRMSSKQFTAKYNSGELGDNAEWLEWEYLLDALGETERQLGLLQSIAL